MTSASRPKTIVENYALSGKVSPITLDLEPTFDPDAGTTDTDNGADVTDSALGRAAIDDVLRSRAADRDRISAALLDLDCHDGHRLLAGASLTGETWRRWDETQQRVALLWRLFGEYQRVLDEAVAVRARRRPDLALLTRLLTGDAVEMPGGEIPLAERTLLGPPVERVTLREAVDRMSDAFERAAAVVAAADAAWTALLVPLEDAERAWRDAARLARALDGARRPELDRLGRELDALGRVVRSDPLSLVADGRADTERLDALSAELTRLCRELDGAVRLRDAYDERTRALAAAIGAVAAAEDAARRAHAAVRVKIDAPDAGDLPPSAPALRDRLAALDRLRAERRWTEAAARADDLDRAACAARDRADAHRRVSTGLLDSRAELRGRLGAYQAKAARLGLAEDDRVTSLHTRAHDLLWTAPCNLREATAAVAEYQRTIQAAEHETGSRR
ncbi:hypothetical protein BTM25_03500 [Actinomadura rubteroloni]|uniref:Uncharacterized protein n=1 Tax=Actinomadura rubteroloni TaxID=1926885 RepID=A0A2P4ULP0_9ACTN|nr:hypothetical protein BTM25_03500 [Actinomadura rubteroloni]